MREDFPALQQEVRLAVVHWQQKDPPTPKVKPGIRLVYLDNAATSQKPQQVLEELKRFYGTDNSTLNTRLGGRGTWMGKKILKKEEVKRVKSQDKKLRPWSKLRKMAAEDQQDMNFDWYCNFMDLMLQ